MIQMLKISIKKTPFYPPLRYWLYKKRQDGEVKEWENHGRPLPPPHLIKQRYLRKYARQYNLKIFVETGTYYGDMVEAMKDSFERIYSIELSAELFNIVKERFKYEKHIILIQGDSGRELANVVKLINQPALFWLDAHYSAGETAKGEMDTPIYEELNQILNAQDKRNVVIIDDARCFGTDPAYPNIEELKEFIYSKRSDLEISIQDDSIRMTTKL